MNIAEHPPAFSANIEDQKPYEEIFRHENGEAVPRRAERRAKGLFQERDRFIPVWREIANYIVPHRGCFGNEEPNRGRRRDYYLLDSAANMALGLLQSGIQGGLTSPSLDWFRLAVDDAALDRDVAVRQWLDDSREVMMEEFARSNLYNCLFGSYGEVAAFGTAALLLEDDVRGGRLLGRLFTAGQYAVAYSPFGAPDAFVYKIWMTAEQIRQKFGQRKLDAEVLNRLRNHNHEAQFEVYHMIQKNGTGDDRIGDFAYSSLYWRPGKETALSVGGFRECPMFCPRWETVGQDSYGYGPGWNALGDSKMLQEMVQDYLIAQKMMIRPPVWMPTAARDVRAAALNPGGVVYSEGEVSARAIYQVNPDIQGQMAAIQTVERKIREAFYADLFLLNTAESRKNMTAYEVEQRQREKLQMLGPVLERLDNELLDPLIGRAFNILERAGKIPPPPEALIGTNITVEYVSPLAIAQKSSSTASMTALLQLVAGLAGIDPGVTDNINPDKVLSEYMRMTGVPAVVIRDEREVGAIRARKRQQQEAVQAQQEAVLTAEAAAKGAQAANSLANAPLGGGSILDGLLGGAATDRGGGDIVP